MPTVKNTIKKAVTSTTVIDQPDTLNYEGAPAYTQSLETKLSQLCMIGVTGDTFYAETTTMVDNAISTLDEAAATDPALLARCIVEGRNNGYIRTINITGLVYLSMTSPTLFRSVFNKVILTGGDLGDFLDICGANRGYGRAVKSALIHWLNERLTEFYAVKYRKQITDAIRLSRPRPFTGRENIFKWIFGKPAEFTHDGVIYNYEMARSAMSDQKYDQAIEYIRKGGLDYQALTSLGDPPNDVWEELAKNMGVMALLKHISKLERSNFFTDSNLEWFRTRFTVEALKKSKVFPFRLYVAYKNISNTRVRNIVADVMDKYTLDYDWSVWCNQGTVVICPDISSSMTSLVSKQSVKPALIAGMFSGFLHKGVPNSIVLPWDTVVHKYTNPRGDSVVSHISKIEGSHGGGTAMACPVEYMIQNNIKASVAVFITDSETWVGTPWVTAWIEYRRRNPDAKAVLIRVDPYNSNPFPESQAKQLGITQVFGWNDNVFPFIEFAALGKRTGGDVLEEDNQ